MLPNLRIHSAAASAGQGPSGQQYADWRSVELLGQMAIAEPEMRIRIVRFDDAGADGREVWLNQWIAPVSTDCHTPFTLRALSRPSQAVDMIVAHADDPDALLTFTRDCGQMLSNTLIIVCMTEADPTASARLLHAGADAVIDLAMGKEVAAAYIRSLARRSRTVRAV